jgi:hypothetical protein
MPTPGTTIEVIQAMLAPGLMISACGLLILGMNNKYSMVVNRIRLLNEERRRLWSEGGAVEAQKRRLASIAVQLGELLLRLRLVRNAVVGYSVAVALFILSSLFIGLRILAGAGWPERAALALFITGVRAVLAGIAFAAGEAVLGYRIVTMEARGEQEREERVP